MWSHHVDLERSAQCVVMAHLHGHGRGRNWGVSNPKRCCLPWSCSRAGAACVWSRRRTDSCEKKYKNAKGKAKSKRKRAAYKAHK